MDVLEAFDLHKEFTAPYAVKVVRGINLSIAHGDTIAIMGRSGEGKSTLLHILGTLEPPTQGTLAIAGHIVTPSLCATIRNKHLGFIFQSFHLLEHYTALDNVLMPARIARRNTGKGRTAYKEALDLLDRVGLADRAHFQTNLLSGGEKQRVAIARALINDPDLILADEPTGNLDRDTSRQVQELLLAFAHDMGKSLIVVTHDHELAARCDQCFRLQDGSLQPMTNNA